jgi:hypothetical protein
MRPDLTTLTEEDADRRKTALRTLLVQMDVPRSRLNFTIRNLGWLNRNLAANNKDHPMFNTARNILTWLFRWESRK